MRMCFWYLDFHKLGLFCYETNYIPYNYFISICDLFTESTSNKFIGPSNARRLLLIISWFYDYVNTTDNLHVRHGRVTTSVRVVYNGIERLVYPLPENNTWRCP
jgi:hypothetical protein